MDSSVWAPSDGSQERLIHNAGSRALWLGCLFVVGAGGWPPNLLADSPRREVVIYLANETAPVGAEAENYQRIIDWLQSAPTPQTNSITASLTRDQQQFQPVVDQEIAALREQLPQRAPTAGLLIATNRLLRDQQCHLWKPGFPGVRTVEIPLDPNHENYIIAANPLCRREVYASLLVWAAKQFDPRVHQFTLIIKSHGSSTQVITPRLAVRAEETNREELLQVANASLPEGALPHWANRLGVSRQGFLTLLEEAGEKSGMHFPLVYLEACEVSSHQFQSGELPENVDRLLFVSSEVGYSNFSYADLLREASPESGLADLLASTGSDTFVLLSRPSKPSFWSLSRLPWFLPLLLWIAWVVYIRRRKRSAPPVDPA